MGNTPTVPQSQKKPSLFRQILAGAMLGIAGGLSADSPGEAVGAGFAAVEGQKDRELKRQMAMSEEERQNRAMQIREEQLELERKRTESAMASDAAHRALLQTQLLEVNKRLALMPESRQAEMEERFRNEVSLPLSKAGASIVAEGDDYDTLLQISLEKNKETPGFKHIAAPHPTEPDKYVVFEVPDDAVTTEDIGVKIGDRTITIPKGTKIEYLLDKEFQAARAEFDRETAMAAARVGAERRVTPEEAARQRALSAQIDTLQQTLTQLHTDRRSLMGQAIYLSGPDKAALDKKVAEVEQQITSTNRQIFAKTNELAKFGVGLSEEKVELPQGNGRVLDAETAKLFLEAAGGDKDVARNLARAKGWVVEQAAPTAQQPAPQKQPNLGLTPAEIKARGGSKP